MTSIKFDEEALKPIVAAAIMSQISDEQKTQLLEQALQAIITAPRDTYGRTGDTPLQIAFKSGVQSAAFRVVQDLIAERPEFHERIKEALGPVLDKFMEDRFTMREMVSNALANELMRKYDE